MKIAYYMPFKPMGHANPSGDLITGTELYNHLSDSGHKMTIASRLRCRWVYYRPLTMLRLLFEKHRILKHGIAERPELWLSYHSYYKAPDLLGPGCSRKLNIPYVLFQGIYSTKRRKQLKTRMGFLLNRKALLAADLIFTNKQRDHKNLRRLVPQNRLSYIPPGIHPEHFEFSAMWRKELHQRWAVGTEIVIITAAMMRPGVKTEGIKTVIESCGELFRDGLNIRLIIAGDGYSRQLLEQKAAHLLPGRTLFLGMIPRPELFQYYSGADIFAFPGIEESLGMVYLEAQSCNLPVVATQDWGGGEAIVHGQTGLLSPAANPDMFTANLKSLIKETKLRRILGAGAGRHIRLNHDLVHNYDRLEKKLFALTQKK